MRFYLFTMCFIWSLILIVCITLAHRNLTYAKFYVCMLSGNSSNKLVFIGGSEFCCYFSSISLLLLVLSYGTSELLFALVLSFKISSFNTVSESLIVFLCFWYYRSALCGFLDSSYSSFSDKEFKDKSLELCCKKASASSEIS